MSTGRKVEQDGRQHIGGGGHRDRPLHELLRVHRKHRPVSRDHQTQFDLLHPPCIKKRSNSEWSQIGFYIHCCSVTLAEQNAAHTRFSNAEHRASAEVADNVSPCRGNSATLTMSFGLTTQMTGSCLNMTENMTTTSLRMCPLGYLQP